MEGSTRGLPLPSSPVKVATLAIGSDYSPQTEGLSAQHLCLLSGQGQFLWSFSYEPAQTASEVKAAELEMSRRCGISIFQLVSGSLLEKAQVPF